MLAKRGCGGVRGLTKGKTQWARRQEGRPARGRADVAACRARKSGGRKEAGDGGGEDDAGEGFRSCWRIAASMRAV